MHASQSLSCAQFFVIPWTVACQAPLSTGFSSKNSEADGLFLRQGMFLTQGSNMCLLHCLHWQTDALPLCHLGSFIRLTHQANGLANIYDKFHPISGSISKQWHYTPGFIKCNSCFHDHWSLKHSHILGPYFSKHKSCLLLKAPSHFVL